MKQHALAVVGLLLFGAGYVFAQGTSAKKADAFDESYRALKDADSSLYALEQRGLDGKEPTREDWQIVNFRYKWAAHTVTEAPFDSRSARDLSNGILSDYLVTRLLVRDEHKLGVATEAAKIRLLALQCAQNQRIIDLLQKHR